MEATPKTILIGVLIFIFVLTGGIVFLGAFFGGNSDYGVDGDQAKYQDFNTKFSAIHYSVQQFDLSNATTCTQVNKTICTGWFGTGSCQDQQVQVCKGVNDLGPGGMFNWLRPTLNVITMIIGSLFYVFAAVTIIPTVFATIGTFFNIPTWFVGTLVGIVTIIGIFYLGSIFFKEK